MHRRRRLLAGVTALSVLLSMATAALWLRSLTTADHLAYSHPSDVNGRYARTDWAILSGYGFLGLGRAQVVPVDDSSADWLRGIDREVGYGWSFAVVDGYPLSWEGFAEGLHRVGFFSSTDAGAQTTRYGKSIEVPDWLLLGVVSIPAQLAVVRLLRARRARRRGGFPLDTPAAATLRASGDGA